MVRNFTEMLRAQWQAGKRVCIDLDSDIDLIPEHLWEGRRIHQAVIIDFNHQIIEATAHLALAYKLNYAFYKKVGEACTAALRGSINCIRKEHPEIPIILDVKLGDISKANDAYAHAEFDDLGADAITISPYLGMEANTPFIERADKGSIVLCRTGNPGAGEFQDLLVFLDHEEYEKLHYVMPIPEEVRDGWVGHVDSYKHRPGFLLPFYQLVALRVSRYWDKRGNCALEVGATRPEELRIVRQLVGNMSIFVSGLGQLGSDLKTIMKNGLSAERHGLIINSSSQLIFSSNGRDFAKAAQQEMTKLHRNVLELSTP